MCSLCVFCVGLCARPGVHLKKEIQLIKINIFVSETADQNTPQVFDRIQISSDLKIFVHKCVSCASEQL